MTAQVTTTDQRVSELKAKEQFDFRFLSLQDTHFCISPLHLHNVVAEYVML